MVFALKEFEIGALLFWRFLVAGVLGLSGALIYQGFKKNLFNWKTHKLLLRDSFWPGFFLAATILPQTWGIASSSATEAAFITTLYVVIVPILGYFWLKQDFDPKHLITVFVALVGTALLVQFHGTSLKMSTFILLINATFAAAHILSLENIRGKDIHPFIWNSYQSLWCAVFCIPTFMASSSPSWPHLQSATWTAFAVLTLGASMISFYLQVRAQKVLKPNTVSLFFILEAVFAAFFSWIFLSEHLSPLQILGAALILSTCAWEATRRMVK